MLTTFSRPEPTTRSFGTMSGLLPALDGVGLETIGHAEHARHGEAPDVGIEDADGVAHRRDRGRQVHGDARLADAALAARDGEDAGGGGDLGVGSVLAGVPAGLEHRLAALVGVHLAPLDAHVGDAGMTGDPGLDVALDLGAQWANRRS